MCILLVGVSAGVIFRACWNELYHPGTAMRFWRRSISIKMKTPTMVPAYIVQPAAREVMETPRDAPACALRLLLTSRFVPPSLIARTETVVDCAPGTPPTNAHRPLATPWAPSSRFLLDGTSQTFFSRSSLSTTRTVRMVSRYASKT